METSGIFFGQLNQRLGLKPKNKTIFQKAFTHSSMNLKDDSGHQINFERLEFLGDTFLDTLITEYLFDYFPNANEGELSKLRAKIVSREKLNEIGKKLGLIDMAKTAVHKSNFGNDIHGDLLEALIGAIFVEMGYNKAKAFVMEKIIVPFVDMESLNDSILSYKSVVIEFSQKRKLNLKFNTKNDGGLDPNINYCCEIISNNKIIAKARDISKKKAEEKAAKRAYTALKIHKAPQA